jgi:phosphoglycolate phosphatase-like HAD superfamily hydrolase
MFLEAAEIAKVDPHRAAFIGDQLRDVTPAERFEGTAWLVETGHSIKTRAPIWVRQVPTLYDAIMAITD